jgi:D-aspartate ligase
VSHGHSTALEVTDAADVKTLGRILVERLGLSGVAKFDFKRGPDGTLHLLEVNPRFNLWHHLGAMAGVNIPALVYGDLIGLPRPASVRARAGSRWCRVWEDLRAARAHGMPLLTWLPWALGCEAKSVVAWDDPMPLLGAAWFRGTRALLELASRTHPKDRAES